MILHRAGGNPRRSDVAGPPESVPELGRNLRRARTRQGLSLDDVTLRTGLPAEQLDCLEAGTVDRIPDRIIVLRTLRRYADFLGLPGERYVLLLVDNWPVATVLSVPAGGAPSVAVHQAPGVVTGPHSDPVPGATVLAQGGVVQSPLDTGAVPVTAASRSPSTPPAATAAGRRIAPPGTAASTPVPVGSQPGAAQVNLVDTGVTPAIRPTPPRKARAPFALKLVVAVVALAVVLGVAGLLVHRYKPQWLNSIGITHAHTPAHHTNTAVTGKATALFTVATKSATGATFDIHAPAFLIRVEPVGSASWMQATDAQHVSPVFAGVVGAGQVKDFLASQSFTLEVGSPTAHVFVSVGSKVVGFYFPPAAPFTMNFVSVS